MRCPRCQHENAQRMNFCGACGTPLTVASSTARSYDDLKREVERLGGALTEALEQQTATAEILRVISSSPADVQPVFAAVLTSAARLCDAFDAVILQVDGDRLRIVAHEGPIPTGPPFPLRGTAAGRAVLDRRTIHVADLQAAVDEYPESSVFARSYGFRTTLLVPLLRGAEGIGAISIRRTEARPFTDKQIALLETFADQAVIAIENVRLFQELEARNAELTESLDQQTATAEILRVIASSPTDLQPVMEAIAENAARVCRAMDSGVFLLEGELGSAALRRVSRRGSLIRAVPMGESVPVSRDMVGGRVVFDRRTIHVEDVRAAEAEFPVTVSRLRQRGSDIRTMVATPLLREGTPLGVIYVNRGPEPNPFSVKQIALLETFANQAVIAIENVRLFHETKEALEQQTATADILRVISSSPTDLQPVFDAIAERAMHLCRATSGGVTRFDGELVHLAALANVSPETTAAIRSMFPMPPSPRSAAARSILTGGIVHIPDIVEDAEYGIATQTQEAFRSVVSVPMLHKGKAIGAVAVGRPAPGPFPENQVELLKTFADQAVIAIENVRLFNETKEALEQQTATGEILRVISTSPTDVQPVFDTILDNATRLCQAERGALFLFDGEAYHAAAFRGAASALVEHDITRAPIRPGPHTALARVLRELRPVHIEDVLADAAFAEGDPLRRAVVELEGMRTLLMVPLLKEGRVVGAFGVHRREVRPFTDSQIGLMQTFAAQAVIAIENVRLFNETKEALERQTATADILRVISSSPTDLQPVFDAMVQSAVRLCDGLYAALFRFDGELVHFAAQHNLTPEGIEGVRRTFPVRPTRALGSGRAILSRAVVHMPDVEVDPEYAHQAMRRAVGFRSGLWVPMMREGAPIGVIAVVRAEPGPFSDNQIELLKTFADQAVIAVENVRLFQELRARTAELTRSVAQLTALGEVGRAVSSTLDVDTVLDTIVTRANQLAGTDGCSIFEYDEAAEVFRLRTSRYADPREAAALDPIARATPIPKGQGLAGRAALRREPVHIPDIAVAGAYDSPLRAPLLQAGYRALLGVPLLHEERVIGVLAVSRKTTGDFAPEVVDVLKTFATQSVLAIHNAHLFRELEAKSRLLEAASRHKSEFLANMSHELRTPLNAILGFSEVLAERMFGEVNAKQAEYLQDILSSGRHLLSLINDILDLSKVEAGRLELELERFHFPTALDNALTLVRERATRHGITLTQTVGAGVGDMVADERKVKQILLNLLSNAVKFTPEGGRVGLTATAAESVVTIAVSDTGIGIAPEDQASIFEEFRQVGRDDARKQEGTGLGLTLAKKFVELHGGQISLQSQVGQGSTFTFTLPVRLWPTSAF